MHAELTSPPGSQPLNDRRDGEEHRESARPAPGIEVGAVELGAHLYDEAGTLLAFDFRWEHLVEPLRDIQPGGSRHMPDDAAASCARPVHRGSRLRVVTGGVVCAAWSPAGEDSYRGDRVNGGSLVGKHEIQGERHQDDANPDGHQDGPQGVLQRGTGEGEDVERALPTTTRSRPTRATARPTAR